MAWPLMRDAERLCTLPTALNYAMRVRAPRAQLLLMGKRRYEY